MAKSNKNTEPMGIIPLKAEISEPKAGSESISVAPQSHTAKSPEKPQLKIKIKNAAKPKKINKVKSAPKIEKTDAKARVEALSKKAVEGDTVAPKYSAPHKPIFSTGKPIDNSQIRDTNRKPLQKGTQRFFGEHEREKMAERIKELNELRTKRKLQGDLPKKEPKQTVALSPKPVEKVPPTEDPKSYHEEYVEVEKDPKHIVTEIDLETIEPVEQEKLERQSVIYADEDELFEQLEQELADEVEDEDEFFEQLEQELAEDVEGENEFYEQLEQELAEEVEDEDEFYEQLEQELAEEVETEDELFEQLEQDEQLEQEYIEEAVEQVMDEACEQEEDDSAMIAPHIKSDIPIGDVVLRVENLTKKFGKRVSVNNVSFDVHAGEVFGFLGPNGAGKTTTIRMIAGLAGITAGEVYICGKSIKKNFKAAVENIGGIIENPEMYKYMTGWENMKYYASLYSKKITDEQIMGVVELVRMEKRIHEKVKRYSLGMRQRVGIAQSLLHNPKILLLDEPTNGLDPAGIHEMRDFLKMLAHKRGIAIFISSHILTEMQLMCDRVAIISNGDLVAIKTVDEWTRDADQTKVIKLSVNKPELAAKLILEKYGAKAEKGGSLLIFKLPPEKLDELSIMLAKSDISVKGLTLGEKSLEETFLELTASVGNAIT